MKVIQTMPGESEFSYFEALPKILYADNSIRHNQSENINTDYLDSCYVLLIEDEPKARLCLYNNPELTYRGKKAACVGNYECIDEQVVSSTILETAMLKAKQSGAGYVIGPMNGSTWDSYRFSIHHHYPPFLLEPYHHVYYNLQFLKAGFEVISRYKSSLDRSMNYNTPDVMHTEASLKAFGLQIRNINMDDFDRELDKLFPFISEAFKKNFLYTPIQRKTFFKKYKEAAPIIQPEFCLIAEDNSGNIAGFIFSYLDLLNRNEKSIVIKTLARDASPKWKGLGYVLTNKVLDAARQQGVQSVIHAFMIEEGYSTKTSVFFQGKAYKEYALYGIAL